MCLQCKSFENTVGKGEIACQSNFSFSHSVFYSLGELSAIFVKFEIVIYKLFLFGKVQFAVWEKVIPLLVSFQVNQGGLCIRDSIQAVTLFKHNIIPKLLTAFPQPSLKQ